MNDRVAGFTLIETAMYIALLSLLIGGGLVAAYSLAEATSHTDAQVTRWEEAHFLLGKLDWVMSDMDSIFYPVPGMSDTRLTIIKTDGLIPVQLRLEDGQIKISQAGGAFNSVTSDNVPIEAITFEHVSSPAAGVHVTFTINGLQFETTKYIRKCSSCI